MPALRFYGDDRLVYRGQSDASRLHRLELLSHAGTLARVECDGRGESGRSRLESPETPVAQPVCAHPFHVVALGSEQPRPRAARRRIVDVEPESHTVARPSDQILPVALCEEHGNLGTIAIGRRSTRDRDGSRVGGPARQGQRRPIDTPVVRYERKPHLQRVVLTGGQLDRTLAPRDGSEVAEVLDRPGAAVAPNGYVHAQGVAVPEPELEPSEKATLVLCGSAPGEPGAGGGTRETSVAATDNTGTAALAGLLARNPWIVPIPRHAQARYGRPAAATHVESRLWASL